VGTLRTEGLVLLKHIKNFRTSGTLMPSSRFLVKRLVDCVDFADSTVIVELGVGNGCVTREILRRMRPDARLVALEIDPAFIEECRSIRDPRLTLREACATELPEVLRAEGIEGVDAVVSCLPLGFMDDGLVARILEASRASLRPHGRFVQFQYSLGHHPRLTRLYGDVVVHFTPANVPPAYVYQCSRQPTDAEARARPRVTLASLYAAVAAGVALAIRTVVQP